MKATDLDVETVTLYVLNEKVFDLDSCPDWAQYAAVNEDGTACWFSDKLIFWMTIGQLRILALDVRRYWRKPSMHTIGSTLLYSDQIRVLNNKRGHYGPLSFLLLYIYVIAAFQLRYCRVLIPQQHSRLLTKYQLHQLLRFQNLIRRTQKVGFCSD